MRPLVEQVEKLLMPELERFALEMQQLYPALQFNVWRSPVGGLTEYQGFDFGVECVFPRNTPNTADNVALSVNVCHLTSTPRVMAEVVWGHPSGHSEAAFRDNCMSSAEWPEATAKTLEELGGCFPRLIRAFQSAVERGTPPTANSQLV